MAQQSARESMTHYDTLGLQPDATPEDIKRAFRAKASAAHPDKGGSTTAMQAINKAHDVLGDPERRRNYDATGQDQMPDSIENQARAVLMQVLTEVMANSDGDWLSEASHLVKNKGASFAATRKQLEVRKRRLEKRSGKIKVKDGENIVQMLIDAQLRDLERNFEEIARAEALHKAVTALLDKHEGGHAETRQPSASSPYFAQSQNQGSSFFNFFNP